MKVTNVIIKFQDKSPFESDESNEFKLTAHKKFKNNGNKEIVNLCLSVKIRFRLPFVEPYSLCSRNV